ncbi:hypothetical protein C7974DRAFT_309855 [Boeremia exigua]|uniref:uncharacterized protein n=1 Tax=Boeremia exigua TaxID=749465 RepID=UPI001E8E00DC|nr:uncharacterized protein C7974DRAFT_309855 [Boeremia exigua]KAH6633719.1 hypothetical protein C7974DRAFT_309855 [Boeremia exigua]
MPTYRSINIELHSQFDIITLPEYYPPPFLHPLDSPLDPPLDASLDAALDATLRPSRDPSPIIPPLIDDLTSTCSVHVPAMPGSQFWISYSVSPPVPEGHYFLFKMYVDGEQVMSWSTGRENDWMGKTMFGLFESEGGSSGKSRVEKRVLCFGALGSEGGCVEIRVHRASGRVRVEREMQVFEETRFAKGEGGIRLVNAGRAGPEHPKRFYKFALIDPVDQPFATFRYYYYTWRQLGDLGLLNFSYYPQSEENDMPVIEPGEDGTNDYNDAYGATTEDVVHTDLGDDLLADSDGIPIHDWGKTEQTTQDAYKYTFQPFHSTSHLRRSSLRSDNIASGTYVPRGAPASEVSTGSPPSRRCRSRRDLHRLSMPPSIRLEAPEPALRPLPVPQKNSASPSTAYRPHPAYPVEEWTIRTPSPVRTIREDITTPPLQKKRGLGITGAGLMGVISSTWKRTVSGAQAPRKSRVVDGPRSVSC